MSLDDELEALATILCVKDHDADAPCGTHMTIAKARLFDQRRS